MTSRSPVRTFFFVSVTSFSLLAACGAPSSGDAGAGGGSTSGGGSATGGGSGVSGGGAATTGGGGGATGCTVGTASARFIPTSGAAQDVTSTLQTGGWTAPGAGTLELCGGSWTANLSPASTGELVIESASGTRAQVTGNVQVIGAVHVRHLDLIGQFYAAGGSAAQPTGTLTVEDVSVHTSSTQVMFDGAMLVTASDAGLLADGSLLGVVAAIDFAHVTVDALKVDHGLNPLLYGGSLRLDDVTATTSEGGFSDVTGNGTTSVTGGQFTTRGPGAALTIVNTSYTVADAGLISDGVGTGTPLMPLMVLTGANGSTMNNLTFNMAGERGGISGRIVACTGCTFSLPAVKAAVEITTGGGTTLNDCTFIGDGQERFIASSSSGIHRATSCTFTNGFAGASGGGAISIPQGQLFLTDCELTGNTTTGNGGAVLAGNNITSTNSLIITGTTFTSNSAAGAGGAVWSANALQVTGSTFTGNTAVNSGGAVLTRSQQNHVIDTSTFHSNDGGVGGAVVYRFSGTNSLIVTNSDFGTGATDNAPVDVQKLLPSETLDTVTRNAGAGATFTCNTTCN